MRASTRFRKTSLNGFELDKVSCGGKVVTLLNVKTSHGYVPSRQHGNPLHPRTFLALIRKTLSKWNDDPTLRFGAGLAYYTAFAVVPLVFIVVEVATWMVGQSAAEGVLMEEAERLIGEQGRRQSTSSSTARRKNGVSGLAAVVEAATLLFALAGAFDQLQDALNCTWGVEPKRHGGLMSRFQHRFLWILGVLGTAFLLLVSLVLLVGGQAFLSSCPAAGFCTIASSALFRSPPSRCSSR